MFEDIQKIERDGKNVYAYKTLMMFTKHETIAAIAMELMMRDHVPEKSYHNKMESPHEILELVRTHTLRYGSTYIRTFPDKWYEDDYCDINELENYWVFKAKDLIEKHLPNMLESF